LERLKKRDIEVLYMVDVLDEYVIQQLKEYNNVKMLCITKENIDLSDSSDDKDNVQNFEKVCTYMKTVLGDSVEKVVVSNRLESSPCVIVSSEYGMSSNMQRIMTAQALSSRDMGMQSMMNKKILEINPSSNIIKRIRERLDSSTGQDKTLNELVYLLYDNTLLSSGFELDDPTRFSNRINRLINLGLGDDSEPEPENEVLESVDDSSSSNMEQVD